MSTHRQWMSPTSAIYENQAIPGIISTRRRPAFKLIQYMQIAHNFERLLFVMHSVLTIIMNYASNYLLGVDKDVPCLINICN